MFFSVETHVFSIRKPYFSQKSSDAMCNRAKALKDEVNTMKKLRTKENRRVAKRESYRASQEAKKQASQDSTQDDPRLDPRPPAGPEPARSASRPEMQEGQHSHAPGPGDADSKQTQQISRICDTTRAATTPSQRSSANGH